MSLTANAAALRKAIAQAVDVQSEGEQDFRVHVPLYYSNGDEITILLCPNEDAWSLSDNGDTLFNADTHWDDLKHSSASSWLQSVLLFNQMVVSDDVFSKRSPSTSLGSEVLEFAAALLEVDRVLTWMRGVSTDLAKDDAGELRSLTNHGDHATALD